MGTVLVRVEEEGRRGMADDVGADGSSMLNGLSVGWLVSDALQR